jgi:intein-encoded DNA endonuclease-like protein
MEAIIMSFKLKEKQEAMKQAAIEYVSGETSMERIQQILHKYNISYASLFNSIKRYNLEYNKTYGRRVFFNEDYFANINSEDKAYWLGFIFADGNVKKTSSKCDKVNRLTIGISIKDQQHLEKFKSTIGHTGELYIEHHKKSYSTTPICYLHCNSIKMCEDLAKLNCLPSKTGYSNLPNIPQELLRHFIRGYFDGDGSISPYIFQITSNENILNQINNIISSALNVPLGKIRFYQRTNKAVDLRYIGKDLMPTIFHYLYDNATVFLERKYDAFLLITQ